MRYRNPELAERLAAEYVLGTLRGGARRRFEGLLAAQPSLRQRVRRWEQHVQHSLHPAPVSPPRALWGQIEQQLWPTPAPERWYQRLSWWRGLSLSSGVLTLALAVLLVVQLQKPTTSWAGVVNDLHSGQPMWLISSDQQMQYLRVRTMRPMSIEDGQGCLLWVRPQGSQQVYLVGKLPWKGEGKLEVDTQMLSKMAGQLLVTVESVQSGMPQQPQVAPSFGGEWVPVRLL